MIWCPQCGPEVAVDCDGLCQACGSTATGEGAEHAARLRQELAAAVGLLRERVSMCVECRLPCEPCWACRTDAFLASVKEDDRG